MQRDLGEERRHFIADISTQKEGEAERVVRGHHHLRPAAAIWVSAVLTVLQGISAIVNDEFVVVSTNYVYKFNTSTWGWIHVVVGILLAAVAFGLFWDATWARVGAIVIASFSIVSMFMWLPHTPIWSIVTIAIDIFIIWAVSTWESPRVRNR